MKRETLYDNFLESLYQRFPQRAKLANVLAEMLCLEKEAIYRRLRKEVPFTFHEVAIISVKMRISVDKLISSSTEISMHMKFADFVNPNEIDIQLLQKLTDVFRESSECQTFEFGIATNILPHNLFFLFDGLSRYFMFKWNYQYSDGKGKKFSEIHVNSQLNDMKEEYLKSMKKIKKIYYIFDNNIFKFLVDDLKYFSSIKLIDKEDIKMLKNELYLLLERMEDTAAKGYYNDPSQKIYYYISKMNFDTSYSYLESDLYTLSLTRAFTMNGFASLDHEAFTKHKRMIHALRKSSVLISESGEWERIAFIEKQREIIDSI
ncbi:MAG: hypothetical protein LUF90_08815 [Rikenellaceae bacterium]|nr:hypothetical protein [Rikenellaceae bacterium]